MLSNCGHDENGKARGGKAGDQGGEWRIINWYNRPWGVVLRHPDPKVREEIAFLAERAAKNDKIGYDQGERYTFWSQLKVNDYDPAKITVPCESDCSAGVLAICKAVGYRLGIQEMKDINQNGYTGTQREILKKAGFKDITDNAVLRSEDYLYRGDILLYEFKHTATCITDGDKVKVVSSAPVTKEEENLTNVGRGQQWLNSNYGSLVKEATGSLLDVDNEYGDHSRRAAVAVWKYVVNKKFGTNLTPSNENFLESCKEAAGKALIRLGSVGTLTYIAQFILAAKGYYTGKMDADYGSGTYNAVVKFQKDKGLEADGIIGSDTWYALFN